MTPHDAMAAAIGMLETADSLDDVATSTRALVAAMELQRYTVVELRRGVASRLLQNAPAELVDEAAQAVTTDPLITRARASPCPFVWQASIGSWRHDHAPAGYRSGVAAVTQDAERSGCIVLLSCDAESIAAERATTLTAYALAASAGIASALDRLAPNACPLSPRELDCLLYTLAGLRAKDAAQALGLSARTVEQYLERARERLGASNSYAAATTALRCGWLDLQKALELSGLVAAPGAGQVGVIVGIDDTEQGQEKLQHGGLQR